MSASTRRIAELETAQEAERDSLRRRHRIEIEKFHQWVEAEILAACYNAPPGPSDSIVRPERFALNSSVCEYLLKQRYGNDVCATVSLFVRVTRLCVRARAMYWRYVRVDASLHVPYKVSRCDKNSLFCVRVESCATYALAPMYA